jgi:F420-non-reducing hydrogenase small subunit
MSKPKIGLYWCASCGGCEEAVVDLAEDILKVVAAVDIVLWPVAFDFKKSDVEQLADDEMAVCFINGAIRTSEQLEMAKLLRKKAGLIVAFGSCSQLGGIPGMANFKDKKSIQDRVYYEMPTTENPKLDKPLEKTEVAEGVLTLPTFDEDVRTLDQTIDVDYYLPGCPPPVALIVNAVMAILENNLPSKGSVLAPNIALCNDCPRKESKPDELLIKEFKRPHQVMIDPEKCMLEQGVLCMGAVTRSGCESACIEGNMPCSGCMGPTDEITDYGAKALSAIASIIDSDDEKEISLLIDNIVDPGGTFYRYSLPASLIHRTVLQDERKGDTEWVKQ